MTIPAAESPAERVSTPVDGVDVLGAISPSRAGDFMSCPLMYRFRTIDRLPEAPSPDAVRGTVVHKVFDLDVVGAMARVHQSAYLLSRSYELLVRHTFLGSLLNGRRAPWRTPKPAAQLETA